MATKAIEIDVNFTGAYNLLVGIYVKNERLAEAAQQLEALLVKQPDNIRARLTSALTYE